MKKTKKYRDKAIVSTIVFCVLCIYTLIIGLLIVWAIATSLKGRTDYVEHITRLYPSPPIFKNYSNALKYFVVKVVSGEKERIVYIEDMFFNSVMYMVGTSFLSIAVTFIAAYLTARYKFFFSKIIYFTVIFAMSVRIFGSTPAAFKLLNFLHLRDSVYGLWFLAANFTTGTMFLIIHTSVEGIPQDIINSANIDGASHLNVLVNIGVPMVSKVLLTFFMLKLISAWNDYQTPMLFMPSYPTLAYGVYLYTGNASSGIGTIPERITGSMFLLLPTLIIFLFFNEKLMGNLSMGALKE